MLGGDALFLHTPGIARCLRCLAGVSTTVSEIQAIREVLPEIDDMSLQEIWQQERDSPRFRIGTFPYLRALELRHRCEGRGITVELE